MLIRRASVKVIGQPSVLSTPHSGPTDSLWINEGLSTGPMRMSEASTIERIV
jgi:hypothetical protein